jgi:hypothetical protein
VEDYGRLGKLALAFLDTLADAAVSSVGFGAAKAAFLAGVVHELCVVLVQENAKVYEEALAVAGRTEVWAGALVPTADVV